MSNLIDEIRAAREALRRQEAETSESASRLRLCKDRERKARKGLDALLDELETGQSLYPLPGFDRLEPPPVGWNPACGVGQRQRPACPGRRDPGPAGRAAA